VEQKVVKVINAWAFLNYLGHVPGLPPKSTHMHAIIFMQLFVSLAFPYREKYNCFPYHSTVLLKW